MSNVTYFSNSRPIVATLPAYVLPISQSDMTTALGGNIAGIPAAMDMINSVVLAQTNLAGLTPGTPAYTALFASMSAMLRQIGLYPTGYSTGPSSTAAT